MPERTKASRKNKTGLLGVYFDEQNGKFRARIMVQGVNYDLGYFDDAKTASRARAAYRRENYDFVQLQGLRRRKGSQNRVSANTTVHTKKAT